jgi:hypothetical protein
MNMIEQIKDGRTDLVFEYLASGHAAASTDDHGTGLINWCAYYRDVSAIKHVRIRPDRPPMAASLSGEPHL